MSVTEPTLARGVVPRRDRSPAARLRRFQPTVLIWAAAILVLLFLVASPVLRLLLSSFQSTDTGRLTLENYGIAYGHARDWLALCNSLLYALAVTVLSAILAVPVAWGVSRTDMPGKGFVRVMILGAFITPPYLGAIAWILLAARMQAGSTRSGWRSPGPSPAS